MSTNGTSKRIRASLLMLAAFAMLFAGLGATCDALCCPLAAPEASVHAMMACCAGASSMSRSEAMRIPAATTNAQVQTPAPVKAIVAIVTTPAASSQVRSGSSEFPGAAQRQAATPLFLRNAQLLI